MNTESFIMPALEIILAAAGVLISYTSMKAKMESFIKDTERRFSDGEADRKDLRTRLEQVDRDTVKRDDFNRFDDKIAARFEKVEHIVNNGAMKTAQLVRDMMRGNFPAVNNE